MNLAQSYKDSRFVQAFSIFGARDRKHIFLVVGVQIFLGFLDLVAVGLIGILGALSLNGVQSKNPGNRVSSFLRFIHINEIALQSQVALIGSFAAMLFVSRTLISITLTRRVLYFLSRRGAVLSTQLIKKLLAQSLTQVKKNSMYENLYALTYGVSNITLGVLGSAITLVADTSLLVILFAALFILNPVLAMGTIIFFVAVGWSLYKFMHVRASKLGELESQLNILSNARITEVLETYRELVVRDRRSYYSEEIGKIRFKLANNLAESAFLPNVSKYVIESALVVGGLIISATQFMVQDATHAVATLAVFLAAGTRIAPAVLRIQQGAVQIRKSLSAAEPTLALLNSLDGKKEVESKVADLQMNFVPRVEIRDTSFSYDSAADRVLSDLNISIDPGKLVAIVGPSGAGKSTLIDLILGVLQPSQGSVKVGGVDATQVPKIWPGAMGYVPQDVVIINDDVFSNVSLGFPIEDVSSQDVWNALELAQLKDWAESLPNQLNSLVGEKGSSISGGQRQRLGIARALYTRPSLLVLDEATSALDGETESRISSSLRALQGKVTIILIAHRLSTVRDADLVIYMDFGRIISSGSFEHVRSTVPDFDNQAKLMGL